MVQIYFLGGDAVSPCVATDSLDQRVIYITRAQSASTGNGKTGIMAICPTDGSGVQKWTGSQCGNRPAAYGRYKEKVMGRILKRIEESCPEIRGAINPVAGATPLTIRDYGGNLKGSLYGTMHSINQYNPSARTRIQGLYLAGQATFAPGILGAALSAVITCGHILGHEKLQRDLWESL